MAEPTLVIATSVAVGTKALQSAVSDLYGKVKGTLNTKIRSWKTTARIRQLFTKIHSVRNVKTIWQVDKEVDLLDFYYPTAVLQKNQSRKEIRLVSEFDYAGNILVQGIVGQGKSMFLRFLCSQELYQGNRVPLFIELRQITAQKGIRDLIIEHMEVLGIDVTKSEFNALARTGKLILFLDAFDEVPENAQQQLVTDLEKLANTFESLQFVVTSRPDSALVHSAQFRVFALASLTKDDLKPIIFKLTDASAVGERLVNVLESNPRDIHGILTTPLMVTLLVIKFCADEVVPDRLSDFYEDLFDLLFHRHDKTKPGYLRETKCGLNDRRMRRIFNAFCFLMRQDTVTNTTRPQALDYSLRSIELSGEDCDESAFLDDIVQVTNLVLRESNRYFFLHKSVQEFHSASYLREIDDTDVIEEFYKRLLAGAWLEWREELVFLREIDTYRFATFFLIPDIERFFSRFLLRHPRTWKSTPESVVKRLLKSQRLTFSVGTEAAPMLHLLQVISRDPIEWGWALSNSYVTGGPFGLPVEIDPLALIKLAQSGKLRPNSGGDQKLMPDTKAYTLRGDQLLTCGVYQKEETMKRIHLAVKSVISEYHQAQAVIETELARNSVINLRSGPARREN